MSELFSKGAYFASPPRMEYVYSNYGYAALGRIVTNASGRTFQQFITDELLNPLGMHTTTWTPVDDDHARPFRLEDDAVVFDMPEALGDGGFAAMGGLWSTVDDLLKWSAFFLDAYPARSDDDSLPLRRSSRREMQRVANYARGFVIGAPSRSDVTVAGGYGMGLIALDDPLTGMLTYHAGGLPGYGSMMVWLPNRAVEIIATANITYAPMRGQSFELLEKLKHADAIPAAPQLEVPLLDVFANLLVGLFNNWDDERANEIFAMNVPLDLSYERRRKALHSLGRLKLRNVKATSAANATAIVIDTMTKQLHWLTFSLSSESVPKVQAYKLTPMKND